MKRKDVKEGQYVLVIRDRWENEPPKYYESFLKENPLGIVRIAINFSKKYPIVSEKGEVRVKSLRSPRSYIFHVEDLKKVG